MTVTKNITSYLSTKSIFFSIVAISIIALFFRFYFFPLDVPLNSDALTYFWYSSEISQVGELPKNWMPINNGWPIFVSIFFMIFDSKDIFMLMQIQRFLSVLISIAIIIPTYFLCKKFVARKFALIGVALIAFDPRLVINSFLGTTDPLYFLLIATSLTLFLFDNKKFVYVSFVLASLAAIVRGEAIVFLLVLSIVFLIRYRKEKYKIIFQYVILLTIAILIILPFSLYRIEVTGVDGIFMRSLEGGNNLISNLTSNEDSINNNSMGLELFFKYLIWILIPNFIIFVPFGLFLIFKNIDFKKITIILSLIVMSLPALYAYSFPVLDTRYLYVLFPMFSVLAVLSIEKIIGKLPKQNMIIIIIILAIILSSVLFYDYKKIDYEHEKESFEIMNKISNMFNNTNSLNPITSYFATSQTIKQWPSTYSQMKFEQTIIPITNYNSLNKYIVDFKDKNLTHIITDNQKEQQGFIVDIFENENNYPYLEKIYDSKIDGFSYHVKVFEINYELFDSVNNDNK
jgi:4-amino-4-deoxy-L-arabinose transferase-like glycosyltransferase